MGSCSRRCSSSTGDAGAVAAAAGGAPAVGRRGAAAGDRPRPSGRTLAGRRCRPWTGRPAHRAGRAAVGGPADGASAPVPAAGVRPVRRAVRLTRRAAVRAGPRLAAGVRWVLVGPSRQSVGGDLRLAGADAASWCSRATRCGPSRPRCRRRRRPRGRGARSGRLNGLQGASWCPGRSAAAVTLSLTLGRGRDAGDVMATSRTTSGADFVNPQCGRFTLRARHRRIRSSRVRRHGEPRGGVHAAGPRTSRSTRPAPGGPVLLGWRHDADGACQVWVRVVVGGRRAELAGPIWPTLRLPSGRPCTAPRPRAVDADLGGAVAAAVRPTGAMRSLLRPTCSATVGLPQISERRPTPAAGGRRRAPRWPPPRRREAAPERRCRAAVAVAAPAVTGPRRRLRPAPRGRHRGPRGRPRRASTVARTGSARGLRRPIAEHPPAVPRDWSCPRRGARAADASHAACSDRGRTRVARGRAGLIAGAGGSAPSGRLATRPGRGLAACGRLARPLHGPRRRPAPPAECRVAGRLSRVPSAGCRRGAACDGWGRMSRVLTAVSRRNRRVAKRLHILWSPA